MQPRTDQKGFTRKHMVIRYAAVPDSGSAASRLSSPPDDADPVLFRLRLAAVEEEEEQLSASRRVISVSSASSLSQDKTESVRVTERSLIH